MNDLNSVFLVGKVIKKSKTKKGLVFTVQNNHYYFDEKSKEYVENKCNFTVLASNLKFDSIKKGVRIGINGRLSSDGIVAYSIQKL